MQDEYCRLFILQRHAAVNAECLYPTHSNVVIFILKTFKKKEGSMHI